MSLSKEKLDILKLSGSVLITANPGTGKTTLLAAKYVQLVQNGTPPEKILCLTYTNKARKEMEERISSTLAESKFNIDPSKLHIHTFHSWAMENIDVEANITTNLLRYSIFRYLKDNETLHYGDDYLLSEIVPAIANKISYLKSFGITPEQIDISKTKKNLADSEKYTKAQLESFLNSFVGIFSYYESVKRGKGIDYPDMLLHFRAKERIPQMDFVLVDELQDINAIEGEIALRSGKTFFAVGDPKQAIFGFQGGSISNLSKFKVKPENRKTLSENRRSSNEILKYAKSIYDLRSTDKDRIEELENLRNPEAKPAELPIIIEIDREQAGKAVLDILNKHPKERFAVIARTNSQIQEISKVLKENGLEHSTTASAASYEAKNNAILFLKGLISSDSQIVRNSMFTPFFPLPLQGAFQLADEEADLKTILAKCPVYALLRKQAASIEGINQVFIEQILPIAVTFGKDYTLACLSIQKAFVEALATLDRITYADAFAYLESAALEGEEYDEESRITLITAHKAKGMEFDKVIYIPSKTKDSTNFIDNIVEAILVSNGLDAKEEIEEEPLRIDFVAFTRAKNQLFILTDKQEDYLTPAAKSQELIISGTDKQVFAEKAKKAYSLFLAGDDKGAHELLKNSDPWLLRMVRAHFNSLDRFSYSTVTAEPFDYLQNRILGIGEPSEAMETGKYVHSLAQEFAQGNSPKPKKGFEGYATNLKEMLGEIRNDYPDFVSAEIRFCRPIQEFLPDAPKMSFSGVIDAIFKGGDKYLIVDWKTDKDVTRASSHRRQLEVYKRAYATENGISIDKINVAIGFVGISGRINTGTLDMKYDDAQPQKKVFETFQKNLATVVGWKQNPDSFLEQIAQMKEKDFFGTPEMKYLFRSIVEEYKKERDSFSTKVEI